MKIVKTYSTRPADVESRWHVFDATDVVLGRLATEVSVLLQGKHKPTYARHVLTGDYVIVVNAARVKVTGAKTEQKMYRRHSHYPGALRETPLSKVLDSYPDRVIREAVRGMLPKNTLGRRMLRRLRVYAGETHPHGAQVRDLADEETVAAPVARDDTAAVEMIEDAPVAETTDETAAEVEVQEVEAAEPASEVEAAEDTTESARPEPVEGSERTDASAEVEAAELAAEVEAAEASAEVVAAEDTTESARPEPVEGSERTDASAEVEAAELAAEVEAAEAAETPVAESDTNQEEKR